MSKDITIEKVGVPQELNGVKKIVTNSPDFFQATWIPEESTKPLGKLTVHRNGHYEASDFYAYGFDEVEVDVPQTPPEIEGIIDWGIPPIDIDFPDIDINIDDIDIGDIDIDIPDIDPMDIDIEDLEIIIKDIIIDIIDDLDIDIDIDDIDIDIPDIDLADFTPEELKDLIDDIIKDTLKDILGTLDIDDIDIDIPDVDVRLPDVEMPDYPSDLAAFSHIDENGNIVGITNQDLEDMGKSMEDIAAMDDPVITIDDLGNIDIVDSFGVDDFGGVEVIDLAIGDVDLKVDGIDDDGRTKFIEEYLPTSIELTVPPNKLVYHDGEPIDLTGAIVSAKYKGGTAVWANEKYPNGIIPLGELIIDPQTATKAMGKITSDLGVVMLCGDVPLYSSCYYSAYSNYGRPAYGPYVKSEGRNDGGELKTGHVFGFTKHIKGENNYDEYDELWGYIAWDAKKDYWASETGRFSHNGEIVAYHGPVRFGFDNLIINDDRNNKYVWMYTNHNVPLNGKLEKFQDKAKEFAWTSVFGDKTASEISLSWHRPKDKKILSTSFEIAVSD